MRSTPASVHSRRVPPGRNSPSSRRPSRGQPDQHALRRRLGDSPYRAAKSAARERRVRARVAQREVAERIARPARAAPRAGPAAAARRARRDSAPHLRPRCSAIVAGDRGPRSARRAATSVVDARPRPRRSPRARRSLRRRDRRATSSRSCTPSALLRAVPGVEPLQLALDRVHRVGIEQLAQLRVAEQLAQLRLIDGQRLRAPLGQRRVAVVEEAGDVAEEQRRGKRRRLLRVDGDDADLAAADVGQRRDERRHVEEVAQALAIGFEQHRKRSVARRDGQQIGGALALLPERRAHARAGASAGAASAPAFSRNFAAKSAVAPSCRTTSAWTSSGSGSSSRGSGGWSTSGNRTTNPSSPQSVSTSTPVSSRIFAAAAIAHGAWIAAAARRQDADAPVAELVAHALDDDRRGVGDGARPRPSDRGGTAAGSRRRARRDRARASAARSRPRGGMRSRSRIRRPIASPSSSGRPARSPFQNGILPGSPGAGDTSTRSCVISSMRQDEAPSTNVSPTRLSNTISSSSSPTRAAPGRRADQEDAVQPAVGNRAAVGDRDALRAFARDDRSADRDPR